MERNYDLQGRNEHGFDPDMEYNLADTSHTVLNGSASHENLLQTTLQDHEDLEEKVVAKTLEELDADILHAMEKLSITDDEIKSSTSESQSNQNSESIKKKDKNSKSPDQGSTNTGNLEMEDYIQIVCEELLKELQNTQDLDSCLISINKAMEYVKDESERRIKQKFKKPVCKLSSDNLILKKAVRILFSKLELYKQNQRMVKEYEDMKALLLQKDQEIQRLKEKEMELNYRLNSQTCHLSYNMKEK
ncbi:unnamed protein product [Moneuplotes crassus]|uniref:Uncharacterized protein n=1 Tax=Euplotes crassus TaxID=5936 RepID=A0AAD1XPL3_EUPCR|nr:unnamed protein product [Moneuplotes crassus]